MVNQSFKRLFQYLKNFNVCPDLQRALVLVKHSFWSNGMIINRSQLKVVTFKLISLSRT